MYMCKVDIVEFNGVVYRKYDHSKYTRYRRYIDDKGKALHRAIWEYHNGPIPKGYHIHHKDGDPFNNIIENLACLTPRDHFKAHSDLAKADSSKDIYEASRKWHKSDAAVAFQKKAGKLSWTKKKKQKVPCRMCGSECERKHVRYDRTTCDECQTKRQLDLRKKLYIPKIKNIVDVICEVCGSKTTQKTKKLKRFCSLKCKANSRYHLGTDNVERKCIICQSNFLINRHTKTQTCSDACRGSYISLRMVQGG